MKLNVWQWLGVVLLVIGVFLIIRRESQEKKAAPNPNPPAATQPAPAHPNPWVPAPTQPTATQPAP